MQSLRSEDRPKAAVLCVLVVVMFVLVGMRSMSATSGPPTTAKTEALGGAKPPAKSNDAPESSKAANAPIAMSMPAPQSKVDPFKVVKTAKIAPAMIQMPSASSSEGGNTPFQPLKGDILPSTAAAGEVPSVTPQELSVQGVVSGGAGKPGVAIIKMGNETLIVRGGDAFANGYQLVSVSDHEVVVKKGKKMQTLFVKWG